MGSEVHTLILSHKVSERMWKTSNFPSVSLHIHISRPSALPTSLIYTNSKNCKSFKQNLFFFLKKPIWLQRTKSLCLSRVSTCKYEERDGNIVLMHSYVFTQSLRQDMLYVSRCRYTYVYWPSVVSLPAVIPSRYETFSESLSARYNIAFSQCAYNFRKVNKQNCSVHVYDTTFSSGVWSMVKSKR